MSKGWAAMLPDNLILLWTRDQTPSSQHSQLPPFAKNAKDGPPTLLGDASEIKSLSHLPTHNHQSPVPESATGAGPAVPVGVTLSRPVRAPAFLGLKVTDTWHVAPGAIACEAQLSISEKLL